MSSYSERGSGWSDRKDEPNSPTPGNVQDKTVPDDTGFLIIRFKPNRITGLAEDLGQAVREANLFHINELLNTFNLTGARLISSGIREQLGKLEEKTAGHEFAPAHSLLSYWRIDSRQAEKALGLIEAALRLLPETDVVYREKTISDPLTPDNDTHSALQGFLNPKDRGVDARWVWDLPSGHGEGMIFIDLEQEWLLEHEDLPTPKLIFNDNRMGEVEFNGDHGTGVVGIVAGVDNGKGMIGIAPKVAPVRLVSYWCKKTQTSNLAEAITVAVTTPPVPHVLLIEAQLGDDKFPPETDDAVLTAIQRAVASGVIVVETAGNGNQLLDSWRDSKGQFRLNRNSFIFKENDSGAIMVAAATSSPPHERSIWGYNSASNFGTRIDCYAWGDSIVTCGEGTLVGSGITAYRKNFGGTSGAAAIIAGCALLVQGLHFAKKQSLLSPAKMRDMLSNPNTGIAPGGSVAGHIGVMPNLRAIVEAGKLGPNLIEKILRFIFRTGK